MQEIIETFSCECRLIKGVSKKSGNPYYMINILSNSDFPISLMLTSEQAFVVQSMANRGASPDPEFANYGG